MSHRRKLVERVKAEIDAWRSCPRRIPGGALSAERTPVNPPAPTRLVELDQTVAPIHYEGNAKHNPDCPCEACVPYLLGER